MVRWKLLVGREERRKKFHWTGYRTYPERADEGRTGPGP